jgi:hypothetical protein
LFTSSTASQVTTTFISEQRKESYSRKRESIMKHELHFTRQKDAEKAGIFLYDILKKNVVIYSHKVVFCTDAIVDSIGKSHIINHVNTHNSHFNIKEI